MEDFCFEPGEFVIMQEKSVELDGESIDEAVLTNRSLILVDTVARGLFRRERYVKRCPLERLCRTNGAPQVMTTKNRGLCRLYAVFDDETISLGFPASPKRTAERWAQAIRNAALGDLADIRTEETLPPEIADLVDGARDVLGSVFAGGGRGAGRKTAATETATTSMPSTVNLKCVGCHAPLSGPPGKTVTCPYCDTRQTL